MVAVVVCTDPFNVTGEKFPGTGAVTKASEPPVMATLVAPDADAAAGVAANTTAASARAVLAARRHVG
jgi:hypothetical protein